MCDPRDIIVGKERHRGGTDMHGAGSAGGDVAALLEDACTGGTALPTTLGAGLAYAGYEALKNDHPFKLTEAGFGAAVATVFCALSYAWELAMSSVTELDRMKVPADLQSSIAFLCEVRKSDTIPEALKELDKLCRVNPAGEDMSIAKIADEHIAEIAPTCGSLFIRRSQPPIVVTNVSERAMTTSPV